MSPVETLQALLRSLNLEADTPHVWTTPDGSTACAVSLKLALPEEIQNLRGQLKKIGFHQAVIEAQASRKVGGYH